MHLHRRARDGTGGRGERKILRSVIAWIDPHQRDQVAEAPDEIGVNVQARASREGSGVKLPWRPQLRNYVAGVRSARCGSGFSHPCRIPAARPDRNDLLAVDSADLYLIEEELGRGGSATVYLAQDLRHGRRVALKVLHSALKAEADDPDELNI